MLVCGRILRANPSCASSPSPPPLHTPSRNLLGGLLLPKITSPKPCLFQRKKKKLIRCYHLTPLLAFFNTSILSQFKNRRTTMPIQITNMLKCLFVFVWGSSKFVGGSKSAWGPNPPSRRNLPWGPNPPEGPNMPGIQICWGPNLWGVGVKKCKG